MRFQSKIKMLQEERHQIIINRINQRHKVTTKELCKLLKVSVDTVRRDLQELENSGKLVKVHGGAVSASFQLPFQQPEVYAKDKKEAIAKKAVQLIKDGQTILTGGGTIMLELAMMIPKEQQGVLFTVSPLVALEVAQRSAMKVILLGGTVASDAYICAGPAVVAQLAEISVDICFLGTNSISIKQGVTDHNWELAQVKKALLKSAAQSVVMCLSENLNTTEKIQVAPLKQFDILITELPSTRNELAKYSKALQLL